MNKSSQLSRNWRACKLQKVTEKLFIGDMQDALRSSQQPDINIIIYLGQEIPKQLCFNCMPVCIHLPMNDGRNGLNRIRKILFTAYISTTFGEKVLVACRAGISRSVLVTSALYSMHKNIPFPEAYRYIKLIRQQSQPELNLFREIEQISEEIRCCL